MEDRQTLCQIGKTLYRWSDNRYAFIKPFVLCRVTTSDVAIRGSRGCADLNAIVQCVIEDRVAKLIAAF
jgi:hypothetical protein